MVKSEQRKFDLVNAESLPNFITILQKGNNFCTNKPTIVFSNKI